MAWLGLHTTSTGCHVALAGETRVAATAPQASSALPALALDVLARGRVTLGALEGIAVACGPGSFTGIKIGLASAWGMARPSRVALAGVGSLDALAVAGRLGDGRARGPACVAIAGAYAGLVYVARFACGDDPADVTLDGEYRAGKPAEILPALLAADVPVILEATPLGEVAAGALEEFLPVRVTPSAAYAEAVVAIARYRSAKSLQQEARALYLRADPLKAW